MKKFQFFQEEFFRYIKMGIQTDGRISETSVEIAFKRAREVTIKKFENTSEIEKDQEQQLKQFHVRIMKLESESMQAKNRRKEAEEMLGSLR